MRNVLLLFVFLSSAICAAAGELDDKLAALVGAFGGEYLKKREELLAAPGVKSFLKNKIKDPKITPLQRIQSEILLEWLEKRDSILNIMRCDIVKKERASKEREGSEELVDSSASPGVAWTRYRHWPPHWSRIPKDKMSKLLKVYQERPCLYFIVESLWKFPSVERRDYSYNYVEDFEISTKEKLPWSVKKNPEYIFYALLPKMSIQEKEIFGLALEDKVIKEIREKSWYDCELKSDMNKLTYLGVPPSAVDIIVKWLETIPNPNQKALLALHYLPQLPNLSISKLKKLRRILGEGLKGEAATTYSELFNEYIVALETQKPISDSWVMKYVNLIPYSYPLSFYERLIYRIRPDLKGRLRRVSPYRIEIASGND